jgi:acyl-CoA synthetase (NDP forming)
LPEPSNKLKKKLKKFLPYYASIRNPIDISADADSKRYENVLRILDKSKEFDLFLIIVLVQTPMLDESLFTIFEKLKKPFSICMAGNKAEEIKRKIMNIPIYDSPERAVKSLKVLLY